MSLPKMGIEEDAWQCLEHSNKRVGHAAKLQALKLRGQVEFPDQRALFFRFFFFFRVERVVLEPLVPDGSGTRTSWSFAPKRCERRANEREVLAVFI